MARKPPPAATRFKPGQSGNPSGRPSLEGVRAKIGHIEPQAIKSLEKAAKRAEPWAVTLVLHYMHGKPLDQVEVTGKDGEPFFKNMTHEEVAEDYQKLRAEILADEAAP